MKNLILIFALLVSSTAMAQLKKAEKTHETILTLKSTSYCSVNLMLSDSSYALIWQDDNYKHTTQLWTLKLADKQEAIDFFYGCLEVLEADDKNYSLENPDVTISQLRKNKSVFISAKKSRKYKVLSVAEINQILDALESN